MKVGLDSRKVLYLREGRSPNARTAPSPLVGPAEEGNITNDDVVMQDFLMILLTHSQWLVLADCCASGFLRTTTRGGGYTNPPTAQ